MKTPWELLKESKTKIKTTWRIAFVSALVLGLLIHLPVMLSDIPNHDGLSSMYFDQNMITSGRWFLTVACGFSSYFTIECPNNKIYCAKKARRQFPRAFFA